MRDIEFVSQLDKGKLSEIGCGVACLMMLLKCHCQPERVPSYEALGKDLRAAKPPKRKGYSWYPAESGKAAWVDDVMRWLTRKKISYVCCYSNYWLDEARNKPLRKTGRVVFELVRNGPVMAGVVGKTGGKDGHWIVLTDIDSRTLHYTDPYKKRANRKPLSRSQFLKDWDGTAIAIQGKY